MGILAVRADLPMPMIETRDVARKAADVPYVQSPYDQAVQGMIGAGLSPAMARLYDEMTRNTNGEAIRIHEPRTPEKTTATTIETFAREVFAPAFHAA